MFVDNIIHVFNAVILLLAAVPVFVKIIIFVVKSKLALIWAAFICGYLVAEFINDSKKKTIENIDVSQKKKNNIKSKSKSKPKSKARKIKINADVFMKTSKAKSTLKALQTVVGTDKIEIMFVDNIIHVSNIIILILAAIPVFVKVFIFAVSIMGIIVSHSILLMTVLMVAAFIIFCGYLVAEFINNSKKETIENIDVPQKEKNNIKSKPKSKARKVKINKDVFIKTSKTKKNHYANFPTLADYAKQSSSNNAQKVNKLTKEILTKRPSGDPAQKDTLLHILNGAAKLNGKKCSFFDSTKNIKSDLTQNSYLNAVDGNDDKAAKFVVVLNTLDQFVEEQKYDKADKLLELKEAIANNEDNQVINGVRNKLATAHGVSVDRIVIMDIYINGNAFVYRVTDLTDAEKDKIIAPNGQFQDKMQKLFDDYDKCAIHPALFEQSYDISMFDKLGNKTFGDSENGKYKIGPPGREREYRQPTGWTRYGLKVLGKYGDDKWLAPFQDPGNWYRAFHGTTREAGSSIFNGAFRPGSNNAYGVGVYCSPDVNIAAGYCRNRGGTIKLDTKQGQKEFYFVFQVAVNPATMNNPQYIPRFDPSCENCDYWIAPSGADIRPYGILIKEV